MILNSVHISISVIIIQNVHNGLCDLYKYIPMVICYASDTMVNCDDDLSVINNQNMIIKE